MPTSTPLPTTGTVAGTYTWSASYAGDGNNNSASDQGGTAEQTVVSKAQPSLNTTASSAITLGTTAPTISDTITMSGAYYPTGSGGFIVHRLAARLERPCRDFAELVEATPQAVAEVDRCAPAVAVALLARGT